MKKLSEGVDGVREKHKDCELNKWCSASISHNSLLYGAHKSLLYIDTLKEETARLRWMIDYALEGPEESMRALLVDALDGVSGIENVKEVRGERERLQADNTRLIKYGENCTKREAKLQAENERLKEALELGERLSKTYTVSAEALLKEKNEEIERLTADSKKDFDRGLKRFQGVVEERNSLKQKVEELEKQNNAYKSTLIAIHKGDDLAFVCSDLQAKLKEYEEAIQTWEKIGPCLCRKCVTLNLTLATVGKEGG